MVCDRLIYGVFIWKWVQVGLLHLNWELFWGGHSDDLTFLRGEKLQNYTVFLFWKFHSKSFYCEQLFGFDYSILLKFVIFIQQNFSLQNVSLACIPTLKNSFDVLKKKTMTAKYRNFLIRFEPTFHLSLFDIIQITNYHKNRIKIISYFLWSH